MKSRYDLPCNIAQSLNIIGDRWTLLILHEVLIGNRTFNEIKRGLAGISSNVLSDRLKYLEAEGLLTSELYSKHPPRYKYDLTDAGKGLEPVFNAFVLWGSKYLDEACKKLVQSSTGEEVEIGYISKKTGQAVADVEVIPIPSANES